MCESTRPKTRPSASFSTHFFSTVAACADTVVLVSAFMARPLTDMDRSMSAPKQGRRLSRRDEAALRSGPMAPAKQKVKLCAALLTGIMIPLISRRGFQRSEEHTSELQSLVRSSYAVSSLKKNKDKQHT